MTGSTVDFQPAFAEPIFDNELLREFGFLPDTDAIAHYHRMGMGDDREPVRLLVIGSRAGCQEVVHHLHQLQFRHATSWSPPLPTATPGLYLRINTHYRRIGETGGEPLE